MRSFVYFCAMTLLSTAVAFGQAGASKDNPMPTVEDMLKTLSSDKASESSTADQIIESVVGSMTDRMQAKEVTEQTVRSAVEGTLVREEVVPEINRENVETIDTTTQRYLPRLKLDFNEFPLRRISGNFNGPVRNQTAATTAPESGARSNAALTDGIVRRIQTRLNLETVRYEFKDRTAYLTGTVPTERQRELVEFMLRMEPGIDLVKNDLVVEKK